MFISVSSDQARYRSGAVARMVGIPVSTLRIWERRYQVVGPRLTDSGHRLYTGADVERLLLIRQLIGLGHAVGTVARLGNAELQQIADARTALAAPPMSPAAPARLALLGLGLPRRLGQLALRRTGTWADLAAAEAAFAGPGQAGADGVVAAPPQADLLVAEMATLQPASAERLLALQQRLGARRTVVVYAFGAEVAAQRLRDAGCRLLRAPLADAELGSLIEDLLTGLDAQSAAGATATAGSPALAPPGRASDLADAPPRRFDEAGLAQLSGASTVACECPRHLTDLVLQLGAFETYSAECRNSSPADAALHAHLQRVAGHARAMLESALVRVAEAEAIALPAPPAGRHRPGGRCAGPGRPPAGSADGPRGAAAPERR